MSLDRRELVARVGAGLPGPGGGGADEIVTADAVRAWLAAQPPPADLHAVCRQIDVRRKISARYGAEWVRRDDESPADAATVSGVVTALLLDASRSPDGDGGWALKCVNSALKALELRDDVPAAPELRAWALAILDERTRSDA